jgi:hypothetical protein
MAAFARGLGGQGAAGGTVAASARRERDMRRASGFVIIVTLGLLGFSRGASLVLSTAQPGIGRFGPRRPHRSGSEERGDLPRARPACGGRQRNGLSVITATRGRNGAGRPGAGAPTGLCSTTTGSDRRNGCPVHLLGRGRHHSRVERRTSAVMKAGADGAIYRARDRDDPCRPAALRDELSRRHRGRV